jgi:class 3 adenylate cyclase
MIVPATIATAFVRVRAGVSSGTVVILLVQGSGFIGSRFKLKVQGSGFRVQGSE